MMHIDIQVQHPGVYFEQLQYADDDIVDVAKTACLGLAGMMIAPSPVYHHVCQPSYYDICRVQATAGCQLAEIIEPFETRAIK